MASPPIQTLYFVDGFDLVDYDRAFLKYNGYVQGFNQGSIISGNGGGNAIATFNSAFDPVGAQFSRIFGLVSTLGIHMDYQQFGGSSWGAYDWYTVTAGDGTVILKLHQRIDGLLDVIGPGGLIATTIVPLNLGKWNNLVILLAFGTSGSVSIFINGVQGFAVAAEPCNFGTDPPDRAQFFWDAGFGPPGIALDNYILYDGLANIGPCHVDSMLPISDSPATVWIPGATSPDVPSSQCWEMVNDSEGRFPGEGPDGDFTYVSAVATANQTFQMQRSPCYGVVLGVALNVCGRPLTGFSPQQFNFIAILSAGTQSVGTGILVSIGAISTTPQLADYQTVQACLPLSPATGQTWIDAEITNGNFGFGSIEVKQRITAFNIEKITSLTPQPFNCGGASYSY